MKNRLTTIIVDDEALARRGLKYRLTGIEDIELAGEARNGREALEMIKALSPDLVFLDIQMPGMDGFDVLRALDEDEMPTIVFVTAFDEYAVQAFEANALDYLLKPIDFSRLAKAVGRLKSRLHEGAQLSSNEEDALFLKDSNTIHRIDLSKLQYIEAQGNYAAFIFSDAKPVMTLLTLQKLTSLLPSNFLRIHRSYIINLRKIRHIEGSRLHLQSIHLPIGKSYRQILQDRIQVINS